jgi:hypothetical protein
MTNLQQKTLVNKDFQRAVKTLRRILPKLSFGLLIGTYLISALIMGLFHAENAASIAFYVAAFAVPLAIQAGRGTLVFFFQLNPARIQSRFSLAIVAATGLLGLSIWEAVLILEPYGLSWMVSVCTLMLIGYIIEIMILKETMFATQMELYQNREQWQELKDFYVAREQFNQFMDALHDGQVPEAKFLPVDRSNSAPSIAEPSEQVKPDQLNRSQLATLSGGNAMGKSKRDPVEVLFDLNGSKNGKN